MNRRDFLKFTVTAVTGGIMAYETRNHDESVMIRSNSKEYPFPILSPEIEGGVVKICGVEHNEKFFNEHRGTFENLIKETDCVVTEFKPGHTYPTDRSFEKFYSNIHEICKEEEKDVLNVDPLNWENRIMDIGLILISTRVLGEELAEFIVEGALTRNEFLKLGFASYIFLNTGLCVSTKIGHFISSRTTPFGYGVNDFRNVKIAKGLELAPNIMDKYNPEILSFHGEGHSKPTEYYLEHKKVRGIKEKLYWFPFGLVGDNYIHMYRFESGKWEEIQKMEY